MQCLKDLEKRMSNKHVAEKCGIPRNTVWTWVKNKEKSNVLRQCHVTEIFWKLQLLLSCKSYSDDYFVNCFWNIINMWKYSWRYSISGDFFVLSPFLDIWNFGYLEHFRRSLQSSRYRELAVNLSMRDIQRSLTSTCSKRS